MAVADEIRRKLETAFAPAEIMVSDDSEQHVGHAGYREGGETHFTVRIVSAAFAGQSRVARQRLVYDALADEFAGGLHALAMTTLTPEEAARD